MGYRSEVKAHFYVSLRQPKSGKKIKDEEKRAEELALLIHAFFKEHATKENFPYLNDCFSFNKTGVEFHAQDVKWYGSFDEVQAFNKIKRLYDENFCDKDGNPGFCWEFCRLGEEDDDTEVERSADSDVHLWVSRSIEGDLE